MVCGEKGDQFLYSQNFALQPETWRQQWRGEIDGFVFGRQQLSADLGNRWVLEHRDGLVVSEFDGEFRGTQLWMVMDSALELKTMSPCNINCLDTPHPSKMPTQKAIFDLDIENHLQGISKADFTEKYKEEWTKSVAFFFQIPVSDVKKVSFQEIKKNGANAARRYLQEEYLNVTATIHLQTQGIKDNLFFDLSDVVRRDAKNELFQVVLKTSDLGRDKNAHSIFLGLAGGAPNAANDYFSTISPTQAPTQTGIVHIQITGVDSGNPDIDDDIRDTIDVVTGGNTNVTISDNGDGTTTVVIDCTQTFLPEFCTNKDEFTDFLTVGLQSKYGGIGVKAGSFNSDDGAFKGASAPINTDMWLIVAIICVSVLICFMCYHYRARLHWEKKMEDGPSSPRKEAGQGDSVIVAPAAGGQFGYYGSQEFKGKFFGDMPSQSVFTVATEEEFESDPDNVVFDDSDGEGEETKIDVSDEEGNETLLDSEDEGSETKPMEGDEETQLDDELEGTETQQDCSEGFETQIEIEDIKPRNQAMSFKDWSLPEETNDRFLDGEESHGFPDASSVPMAGCMAGSPNSGSLFPNSVSEMERFDTFDSAEEDQDFDLKNKKFMFHSKSRLQMGIEKKSAQPPKAKMGYFDVYSESLLSACASESVTASESESEISEKRQPFLDVNRKAIISDNSFSAMTQYENVLPDDQSPSSAPDGKLQSKKRRMFSDPSRDTLQLHDMWSKSPPPGGFVKVNTAAAEVHSMFSAKPRQANRLGYTATAETRSLSAESAEESVSAFVYEENEKTATYSEFSEFEVERERTQARDPAYRRKRDPTARTPSPETSAIPERSFSSNVHGRPGKLQYLKRSPNKQNILDAIGRNL